MEVRNFGPGNSSDKELSNSKNTGIARLKRAFPFWENLMRISSSEERQVVALPRAAAAQAIGVSLRTLDRLIQAGAIRTVPVLRRRLVTVEELSRFLARGGYGPELPQNGRR